MNEFLDIWQRWLCVVLSAYYTMALLWNVSKNPWTQNTKFSIKVTKAVEEFSTFQHTLEKLQHKSQLSSDLDHKQELFQGW